jgi:hypothetical protein
VKPRRKLYGPAPRLYCGNWYSCRADHTLVLFTTDTLATRTAANTDWKKKVSVRGKSWRTAGPPSILVRIRARPSGHISNSVALVYKDFKYIYWTEHHGHHQAFHLTTDPLEETDLFPTIPKNTHAMVLQRIMEDRQSLLNE